MKTISQVSIFIENTKGRLANVCGLLGDNNININYCKSDKVWRVRVNEINYSYFKCKDLEEVYKVCNWFAEIPVHATYKF